METTFNIRYQITQIFYETYMKEYSNFKYIIGGCFDDFKEYYVNTLYTSPQIEKNKNYDELIFLLNIIRDNAGDFFTEYNKPQKVIEVGLYYLTKKIIKNIKEHELKEKILINRIKKLQEEMNKVKQDYDTLKKENDTLKNMLKNMKNNW